MTKIIIKQYWYTLHYLTLSSLCVFWSPPVLTGRIRPFLAAKCLATLIASHKLVISKCFHWYKLQEVLFLYIFLLLKSAAWCSRKLHNESSGSKSNSEVPAARQEQWAAKRSETKKKRGGASGDYSSLIIQVVHYAEQSFAHCHTVITLSLCTPLLQNISIVSNLNAMYVLFEHTKRFSQWHAALPADCVWGGRVQKVKSISIRATGTAVNRA